MGGFGTPDSGASVVAPRPATEAPFSPGLPLIGNGIEGLIAPCRFFANAYKAVGPVYYVRYPGRRLLMLAGPEANLLLARPGGAFDIGATYARVTRELGSDRIPNAHDGDEHRKLRRLLAPSLSSHGVEASVPMLHDVVRSRLDALPVGSVQVAGPWLEALVADLVTRSSLGRPAPDGLFADLRRYGTAMGAIAVGGTAPEWVLYTPPIRRSRNRIAAFVTDALEFHRRSPPGPGRAPDLVDALLAAPDAADREPAAQLALAMLPLKNAGIYLARMIGFALYETLRHPELMARARAEVDAAWAGGPPDVEALKGCHTLQGILLEALRFWPMALALPRVVAQPFTFGGYAFEPGQTVYIAGPVTHFLPELFPDPERFDPDRFAPGRSEHRRAHAYAPFGLGSHGCLARGWSLSIASVVLAGLLRLASLELTPAGHRIRVWALPSPVPEARFRFRLTERREPAAAANVVPGPFLARELDVDQRRRMDANLTDHTTPAGVVVFRQGEPADRFFQIRSGEVEVVVESPDAAPRLVARLGPGECFGEMGLLQGVPRTATVRVTPEAPKPTPLSRMIFASRRRQSTRRGAAIFRSTRNRDAYTGDNRSAGRQ